MKDLYYLREFKRRPYTLPMVIEASDGERRYGLFTNFSEKGGLYQGHSLYIPRSGLFHFSVAAGGYGSLVGVARAVTEDQNFIGLVYDEMSDISMRCLSNILLAQHGPDVMKKYKVA